MHHTQDSLQHQLVDKSLSVRNINRKPIIQQAFYPVSQDGFYIIIMYNIFTWPTHEFNFISTVQSQQCLHDHDRLSRGKETWKNTRLEQDCIPVIIYAAFCSKLPTEQISVKDDKM